MQNEWRNRNLKEGGYGVLKNLKNEDNLKSKGDLNNKDDLKIEDNLILKTFHCHSLLMILRS